MDFTGQDPEDVQLQLDDLVIDTFTQKATGLNNDGPRAQVLFLVSEHVLSIDQAKSFLGVFGIF